MIFDDALENIPHARFHSFDRSLRALDIVTNIEFDEFLHNERLEKFDSHFLRKTALIKFKFGTDDYNRTTGLVDTFSEQVLTEASLLTA